MSNNNHNDRWKFSRSSYGTGNGISESYELRARTVQEYMLGARFEDCEIVKDFQAALKQWMDTRYPVLNEFVDKLTTKASYHRVIPAINVNAKLKEDYKVIENILNCSLHHDDAKSHMDILARLIEKDLPELKRVVTSHSTSGKIAEELESIQSTIRLYNLTVKPYAEKMHIAIDIYTPTVPKDLGTGDYAGRG